MVVTRQNFDSVIETLARAARLGFDSETSGLRLHHGDRPFSLVLYNGTDSYYFNFQSRPDIPIEAVLGRMHLQALQSRIFSNPRTTLYGQNIKFDCHALRAVGVTVLCQLYDTWTAAVVLDNSHMSYSLDDIAKRMGLKKSDAVEDYIKANKLWEWVRIPGKKKRDKNKFFDQVPFPLMVDYACLDGQLAYLIGEKQDSDILDLINDPAAPTLHRVMENEMRLLPLLVDMEQHGVKIDPVFCQKAAEFESGRAQEAEAEFEQLSGVKFKASPKVFAQVFEPMRDKWQFGKPMKTGKVNPSFDSDVLKTFRSPIADAVLKYRDAKSKSDFYHGFLHYMDGDNVIHPNFKNAGTASGRFSSSEPNLQNLTSEDEEEQLAQEFVVRRAFVPRPGHIFIMPDYSAMEYRVMLDVAFQMDLIDKIMEGDKVVGGFDVHQAAADLAGVTRKVAKTMNFLLLYGGGPARLADELGIPLNDAYALRKKFFQALPQIQEFLEDIKDVAARRGWIVNWMGRKSNFPDPRFSYAAANYYIQGGCADVMKVAMVWTGEWLKALGLKSRMVLTVHDELVLEVPLEEIDFVPEQVQHFMEHAYQHSVLPMKVEMEWSAISLADKRKGFPSVEEARNQLSQQHRSPVPAQA